MKKLLKKKVNIFGKGIPVFAIVILGMALVSAALVSYLSGMVIGTVTASSPIEQKIGLSESTLQIDPLNLGTMYGGGEKTLYVQTKNLATDKPITGFVNNFVTNSQGVTCNDFSSLVVSTGNGAVLPITYGPEYNLIALGLCSPVDSNTIKLSYGPTPITWVAGQIDMNKIVATFKVNTVGTYTFTSQVVPLVP